ncbi:MAG TPA: KpsF/GutQ family sugar-phosphate isomerase [Gemmatimonadaceae bacterium]|nr:KpsF/GutQ family sugar-phosphate isomerase [Gemmatimonadaceae bacterium]
MTAGAATTPHILARARRVLRMERDALQEAERRLGEEFVRAVELLAASRGRVIVSGVGKSGLIGRKIAATLTSTGTPANFLHPVESLHGDLGIVGPGDVAILLSKSGETEELFPLLQELKRLGVAIIAITGGADSTLARQADVRIDGWVSEEACPHDLAPTTSTTVALALGDALAVTLLEEKGFRPEDFARLHPGGSLGRRLLTRVADVMVTEHLPLLPATATMRQAIMPLAERRGTLAIVDDDRRVLGVLTAGDMSRLMERQENFFDVPVAGVMNPRPKVIHAGDLASRAVYLMETHGIMAMPVLDGEERIVGMVHLHDLMRARIV